MASLEEKHVKLLEKHKIEEAAQTEAKLAATAGAKAPVNGLPTQVLPSIAQTFSSQVAATAAAAAAVMPTTAISTAISTPAPVTTTSSSKLSQQEITQEHILKEIQVTLEERKKLQTYVSKYEKGLQDLERGSSPLHNVSDAYDDVVVSFNAHRHC